MAADTTGINRHTATLFYHKLRELIAARLEAKAPFSVGDAEVDESYFGGVVEANAAGVPRARWSSACSNEPAGFT